jgi:hypothetical protein
MPSTAAERFSAWTRAEIPGEGVRRFRVAFASIWLAYDALDLALGGTASTYWIAGRSAPGLAEVQLGLVASELGLLWGRGARAFALAAFALRALEAWRFFRLNDFLYFSATALILSQCRLGRKGARELAWPRDVLLWQAAWIYFATALLKTSSAWLSGGHLFVRQQYMAAAYGWPYPAFYRAWFSTLGGNAALAWLGLAGEFSLAALLVLRAPKRLVVAVAIALHGFAAVALNVWFFGASMIAQLALLL